MNPTLQQAFEHEMQAARAHRNDGALGAAFSRLERAHILGQRSTGAHVRVHAAMLAVGWRQRDLREIAGQLLRILAAALFSRIWVPEGNTGGADVGALRRMAVPPDLAAVIDAARQEDAR